MVKRASDGMVITLRRGRRPLEGKELTRYMSQLNDYLGFFDKVVKRLRNEEVVRDFAEIFAIEGKDPARRTDFETPTSSSHARQAQRSRARLPVQARLASRVRRGAPAYSVTFTDAQGATAQDRLGPRQHAAESRQLLAKHAGIREQLVGPFLIEYAARQPAATSQAAMDEADEIEQEEGVNEVIASAPGTVAEAKPGRRNSKSRRDPVEKRTPREVFDYVIEQGRKEYQVQRYKGLGEMTAPQLWETTMDPARRTLLQVKLEDIAGCEEIFTTLMGEDVESRRKFIEENALDVKNLDI